ncbi:TonB-dependent siderophore receptor [Massilia sp. NR 4-1]|uniref:TonB-dependent receptor plug domain-containing protein n=1 Tax=Massilia sp. NR 4-1 TaxID=1678028 RepID=UPI000AC8F849|nr:TonB-dependent receptor [Massilia sp. NR 4-1]
MRPTLTLLSTAMACCLPPAHAADEPLQQVRIAAPLELAQRQSETQAKLLIGRNELLQFGDGSLSEALKRQPGISVVNGEVRMRGLGAGYTQVLVNGSPMPQGFSIDSIAPELIERVELLRGGSAEYGAQGVAGTLNVILKRRVGERQSELKSSLERSGAFWNPSATLQAADQIERFSYSLAATVSRSASHEYNASEQRIAQDGGIGAHRRRLADDHVDIHRFSLAPRLNWKLDNGSLSWQSLLNFSRRRMGGEARTTVFSGSGGSYPDSRWQAFGRSNSLKSDLAWILNLGSDTSLLFNLGLGRDHYNSDFLFRGEATATAPGLLRAVRGWVYEDNASSGGKFSSRLARGHSLAIGWDAAHTRRQDARLQTDGPLQGAAQSWLDQQYQASIRRLALYAQDEWEIASGWQLYGGVRWEELQTRVEGFGARHETSVWSPVAQTVWKLPGDGKDQLRLGFSRSYRAPPTRDIVPRRATVNSGNSPTTPDVQGNPQLAPELAKGADIAYESYFGGGKGVVSLSAYARRIDAVTLRRLYLENGNWISEPFNGGKARVQGIEFDTRLPLRELFPAAPPLDLRLNAARNWSRLDALPGPDNHLAAQTPLTANVGVDYRPSAALSLGASLNLQKAGSSRLSAELSRSGDIRRTLDAYILWKLEGKTQLRIAAANLLHPDRRETERYGSAALSDVRDSVASSRAALRLELILPLTP